MALTAFLLMGSMQYWHLKGFISYVMVVISSYCIGCCLNYGTATIVENTPPDKLKPIMTFTVTVGSILTGSIGPVWLVWPQPIPMIAMCTAFLGTVLSTYFLEKKAPEPQKE